MSPPSHSEAEQQGVQVLRIETKQAAMPSHPEVVLSDGKFFNFLIYFFLINFICRKKTLTFFFIYICKIGFRCCPTKKNISNKKTA